MRTYTEEELKAWFDMIIKRYENTPMGDHARMIKHVMFNAGLEKNKLENFKMPE